MATAVFEKENNLIQETKVYSAQENEIHIKEVVKALLIVYPEKAKANIAWLMNTLKPLRLLD